MYIKELQIFGFKSFQEKTTVRFAPGLNCIVGPNGCGKSNILDALRWVLGEQSFSVLRCGKTEDLIFAGTATAPAVNYAEVKLLLSTEDRPELGSTWWQGEGLAEVEIRRRFFRSGESEYYLNRQPCRLRDIQDLFLSQGIGTKAYSIFDLRQMREIIAGNIRKMFEEAASLAKFRDAKEECQRKLELTQADLTRLEDIIAERERIVRSLQRQAGKLRAFQRLKEEEKGLRLIELKRNYERLTDELEQVRSQVAALEQSEAERLAEIKRLEEELRGLHSRLLDVEGDRERALGAVQRQREMIAEIEKEAAMEQQELTFLNQRAAEARLIQTQLEEDGARLEQLFARTVQQLEERNRRLDEIRAELEKARLQTRAQEEQLYRLQEEERNARARLQALLEEEQKLRNDRAKAEAELENTTGAQERVKQELTLLDERIGQVEKELTELHSEVAEAREAKRSLQNRVAALSAELKAVNDRLEEKKKTRMVLQDEKGRLEQELAALAARFAREETGVAKGVFGAEETAEVGKFLEPMPGWERTCEAAFFPLLDFIFCADVGARHLATLEANAVKLRIGFLVDQQATELDDKSEGLIKDERVLGMLADFVQIKPGAPKLLSRIARSFVVVKDRQALEELRAKFPHRFFVTQDGVAWFGDGRLVFVGSVASRLGLGREIAEKERRLTEIREEMERLNAAETAEEQRKTQLLREREEVESQSVVLEKEQIRAESKLGMNQTLQAELQRDRERLRKEAARLEGIQQRLAEKMQEINERLANVSQTISSAKGELERLEKAVGEGTAVVKKGLEQASQLLAAVGEEQRHIERLEVESGHIRQEIEMKRHQINEARQIIEGAEAKRKSAAVKEQERQETIERLRRELQALEQELESFSTQEIARAEEALEKNIAELRQHQEQNQRVLFERRLRIAELESRIKTVVEEAQTSYQTDITTFVPEAVEGFEERLQKVRHRIEALGQVNPLALTEYEEERKDLERLLFQRNDVMQARENLQQALLEIDRHAREQFIATYQEVRTEFQKIFKELFLEGEADLILVNDSNPLESEVAIIAKPRGKNPKRLEQLSDGEKALLAVSLLFAFYQVKPAPFCFLDEVDAPLDDVNVARFADYLKRLSERTQVIVITHNRATVERADVLLGVTAEVPGVSKVVAVSLAEYRAKDNKAPEQRAQN
ncbi:MAG: chromosome segregation protein SMC [candidate division WOR-3 bacterium]|nr:chromosome segregation protein SMC [candidate division WOR-3 bacterium]MDH7519138.1 chromosome segregation protein SMC [bacterium]